MFVPENGTVYLNVCVCVWVWVSCTPMVNISQNKRVKWVQGRPENKTKKRIPSFVLLYSKFCFLCVLWDWKSNKLIIFGHIHQMIDWTSLSFDVSKPLHYISITWKPIPFLFNNGLKSLKPHWLNPIPLWTHFFLILREMMLLHL